MDQTPLKDKETRYGNGPFLDHLSLSLDLPSPPRLIRWNTNLIYDCGESIIRLTPNAFRPRDDVLRELHWLRYVGRETRNVVRVLSVPDAPPAQLEFADEHFTVTFLEKIDGTPVSEGQWGPPHFERLGALAGFMHRIGRKYDPPEECDLHHWDRIPEACLAHGLPDDDRNLPDLNRRVFDHMAAMPRREESYGPIHYDIHAGNYLITGKGRIVLFDFENSCRGHHINDIAVALYYAGLHQFSEGSEEFNESFLSSFWNGYENEHAVPHDETDDIPWLLLNRSLIVYGYLLKIWPGARTDEQEAHVQRVERSIVIARSQLEI